MLCNGLVWSELGQESLHGGRDLKAGKSAWQIEAGIPSNPAIWISKFVIALQLFGIDC
jgi:hypothetical protein